MYDYNNILIKVTLKLKLFETAVSLRRIVNNFVNMSNPLKEWLKFSSINSAGSVINFRIVDLRKDRFEVFLELYMKYFATEESSFRASGVPDSAEAMAEVREAISRRANDKSFHTVVCCLDNNDDEIQDIIAGSTMMLATPEQLAEKKLQLQGNTAAIKKLFEVYGGMLSSYDMIKEFNLNKYFIDRGVFVHPNYRGLGIAQELLKVRRMICKAHGIPLHGAWMTSYGTQKAAERDGWETVYEIQYDEYGKKHGVIFENGPPSCKFMVARIP